MYIMWRTFTQIMPTVMTMKNERLAGETWMFQRGGDLSSAPLIPLHL